MSTTCSFRRWWAHLAPLIGCLTLIVVIAFAHAAGEEKEKAPTGRKEVKVDSKEASKLVDAIVNRNKPPQIVRCRGYLPSKVPLFPKDYDWKEEDRVRKALSKLNEDTSVALWDALVQKVDDPHYCVATYSGNTSDVEMRSVGQVCHRLAYGRLCDVFEQHLPSFPPHGCPIYLQEVGRDLPGWRKDRKDKALYQLQIEVCEITLRKLVELDAKEVSDKEKAEARKKIEAEIKELRRTKTPKEGGGTPRPYPRDEAERVRESYEKGTLEKFESGLNK